jgi:hypothetical protein
MVLGRQRGRQNSVWHDEDMSFEFGSVWHGMPHGGAGCFGDLGAS